MKKIWFLYLTFKFLSVNICLTMTMIQPITINNLLNGPMPAQLGGTGHQGSFALLHIFSLNFLFFRIILEFFTKFQNNFTQNFALLFCKSFWKSKQNAKIFAKKLFSSEKCGISRNDFSFLLKRGGGEGVGRLENIRKGGYPGTPIAYKMGSCWLCGSECGIFESSQFFIVSWVS